MLNTDALIGATAGYTMKLSLPSSNISLSLLNTLQLGLIGAVSGKCIQAIDLSDYTVI